MPALPPASVLKPVPVLKPVHLLASMNEAVDPFSSVMGSARGSGPVQEDLSASYHTLAHNNYTWAEVPRDSGPVSRYHYVLEQPFNTGSLSIFVDFELLLPRLGSGPKSSVTAAFEVLSPEHPHYGDGSLAQAGLTFIVKNEDGFWKHEIEYRIAEQTGYIVVTGVMTGFYLHRDPYNLP